MKKWIIPVVMLLIALNGVFIYFVAKAAVKEPETPVVATKQAKKQPEKPPTAEELLVLVNDERAKVGVAPLKIDKNMQTTAQWKAEYMKENNFFGHNLPGTDNMLSVELQPLTSICDIFGENIQENAPEYDTSKAAVEAWRDSKPHYKAMVDPKYTLTGIAVSGDKIVQHFCIAR